MKAKPTFYTKDRDELVEVILGAIKGKLGPAKDENTQLVLNALATAAGAWFGSFVFNSDLEPEQLATFAAVFSDKFLTTAMEAYRLAAEEALP